MWVTANKGVKIHINSDILTSSLPPAKGPRTRLEEFFVIALSNDQWGKKSKVTAVIVLMQHVAWPTAIVNCNVTSATTGSMKIKTA